MYLKLSWSTIICTVSNLFQLTATRSQGMYHVCNWLSIQLGPRIWGNKAPKSRRRMHAANILDHSIDCNTVLANAQPQQQVNSSHCWVCSRWLWKGVGEILEPNLPIVRISYVITQNVTVTNLNLYTSTAVVIKRIKMLSHIVLLYSLKCHSSCYKNEVI